MIGLLPAARRPFDLLRVRPCVRLSGAGVGRHPFVPLRVAFDALDPYSARERSIGIDRPLGAPPVPAIPLDTGIEQEKQSRIL